MTRDSDLFLTDAEADAAIADPTGAIPAKSTPASAAQRNADGPRARLVKAAVDRVGNAALSVARRLDALDRAQEGLPAQRAAMQEAMRDLDQLCRQIARRKPPRAAPRAGGGIPRASAPPPPGSIAGRILACLPGTTREIAEASGLTSAQVRGNVKHLLNRGLVARDLCPGEHHVYRRAEND